MSAAAMASPARPARRSAARRGRSGSVVDVRLDDQDVGCRARSARGVSDVDRRGLAQVVDVGLEGQAEARRPSASPEPVGRLRTTCRTTWRGLASLTSRAVRISRACSGAAPTMNHGSTAMQWPPTPGPGCRMLTRGWWLASSMTSQTSSPRLLADQRQLVGEGDVDVAVGVLRRAWPSRRWRRRSAGSRPGRRPGRSPRPARRTRGVRPPTTRSLVTISIMIRPGSTRSGQCATWTSGRPRSCAGSVRSGRSSASHSAHVARSCRAVTSTRG